MTMHAKVAVARTCDPITLEMVRGSLKSALMELKALVERTAMSPFIREKKDFHVGIYDGQGRMVYGDSMLSPNGLVTVIMRDFPKETMQPGDIYAFNDCYGSGGAVTHTPDQVFVSPIFHDERIIAFAVSWAHFNDIGGMRPGSLSPDCTEIFQEGLIIPPVQIAEAGKLNESVLRIMYRNSRFPDIIKGDVRALLAALRLNERRIKEYADRFGTEVLEDAFDQLIERTANEVRRRMDEMFAPGEYRTAETLDSDGQGNGPFKLRYRMTVSDNGRVLDTSETDDQSPGAINFLLNKGAASGILGFYLASIESGTIANHGLMVALDDVIFREGSLLQPKFPAALGYRGSTMMRHVSGTMALVAAASNGQSNASHSGYVIFHMRGQKSDGSFFLLSDGIGVGYGARPWGDGTDMIYSPAHENYPCEFVELNYPIRITHYSVNRDTGGPGRWRGGCGIIREMEVLADTAMLSMRIDSIDTPPWGVNGGKSAGTGGCWINPGTPDERYVEGVSDGTILKKGDILRVATGGGGGWGHPYDREAERVLDDVLNGFVSRRSAKEDYGVILDETGEAVDEEATETRRGNRPPVKLFHQIEYKDSLYA